MTTRLFLFAAAFAVASPAFPAALPQSAPEAVVAPAPTPAPAPSRAPRAPRPPAVAAPQVPGTPAPAAAVAPEVPRPRRGQPVNVRVEFTLSDTTGAKAPVTKSLALTVADGETAMVRSESEAQSPGGGTRSAPFSADASARIEGDRIRLFLNLDYQAMDSVSGTPLKSGVRAKQTVVLENGRPMLLSETSDPLSDRQVRVEVKATVLR